MFLPISTHFTATLGIPLTSPALKPDSIQGNSHLKAGLSLQTYRAAYAPFTPNYSGQRLPPTYYRGCWHVVSRGFLLGYRLLLVSKDRSLRSENLLPPRGVAGSEFPPLPNIPTAASRRSLGRVSVPMWPITLSGRLPIVGLVGRYLTNYLIGREPTPNR